MARMSVPQAAVRLGVSPARVRQRIDDGSLVAEKIGGRWLVDLALSELSPARAGRPVSAAAVWWSLHAADIAREAARDPHEGLLARMRLAEAVLAELPPSEGESDDNAPVDACLREAQRLSRSSRSRAVRRLADAVARRDHAGLLAWLGNRALRRRYVAAPADLEALRSDARFVVSGLSDARSGLDDLRLLEGYAREADLRDLVADRWLERPGIDDRPNVIIHAGPILPASIGPMLLAADLAEHGGPRELARAHELLDEAIDALIPAELPA